MPKRMQNLVVFMEPDNSYDISSKGGNMCLNRFCVDEDASFELSAVRYLDPWLTQSAPQENTFDSNFDEFGLTEDEQNTQVRE